MVAIDSLYVCTDAFNRVESVKIENKENPPQTSRPQSKKRSVKVSREGMRKGLTINENNKDLMLETM